MRFIATLILAKKKVLILDLFFTGNIKILIVLIAALNINNVYSGELKGSVGYFEVEHAWRGPLNYAQFETTMKSLGVTYTTDSGFGVGLHYGDARFARTLGRYESLTLEMDHITSLEVFYRYKPPFNIDIYTGIGHYVIPASVRDHETGYYDHDFDNDEGYFIGVEYQLTNKVGIGYKYTMHSRITSKPYDEWTKSHGIYLSYKLNLQ